MSVKFKYLYDLLLERKSKMSIIGLGYVGLPIAVAFAKHVEVIGFDINDKKIENYTSGVDPTREVGSDTISTTSVQFTSDERKLKNASFHIVAVPTPINSDKTPDLRPVIGACHLLGRNLSDGSVIVFESTVYPGVTEEVCVPILEEESGLKCGIGFKVGYSPERINPGDKIHRLETIVKVVSGMDKESLEVIAKVYKLVALAGIFEAESIKVAEAAKVIENSQRDINIAFINELSIIFNRMSIDTKAVLDAANTKWNFLKFSPGLVGGHCIGVDPYYLTYKAEQFGYHSQVILSGRRINDYMGKYVAENLVKSLIKADVPIRTARVAILGLTFKENCPDIRNSRVVDIISELKEYGIEPLIHDPVADPEEAQKEYFINLCSAVDLYALDAVVVAVAHDEYKELNVNKISDMFHQTTHGKVIVDVKGILDKITLEKAGYRYWRL